MFQGQIFKGNLFIGKVSKKNLFKSNGLIISKESLLLIICAIK